MSNLSPYREAAAIVVREEPKRFGLIVKPVPPKELPTPKPHVCKPPNPSWNNFLSLFRLRDKLKRLDLWRCHCGKVHELLGGHYRMATTSNYYWVPSNDEEWTKAGGEL